MTSNQNNRREAGGMASNGLIKRAKKGTCRICQRVLPTDEQVKAVGEVSHGFATGHIWECIDTVSCDRVSEEKLNRYDPGSVMHNKIKLAKELGRFTEYKYLV